MISADCKYDVISGMYSETCICDENMKVANLMLIWSSSMCRVMMVM